PGASLDRALLAERVGALGLLREPYTGHDLMERIEPLLSEGPDVPLPPAAAAPGTAPEGRATGASPTGAGTGAGAPMVGESPAMARVFEQIARVSGSDSTVLITGASGTGKELVARALHDASRRRRGPFVAVNCAAIP